MAEYITSPVPVDPDELLAQIHEYMRSAIPGWEPADGNLDAALMEIFAAVGAQAGEVASDAQTDIFRFFGANLAGITPLEGSPAVTTTTWTVIDSAGYTIPAGSSIAFESDGSLVEFQTVADTVIDSGETVATAVSVIAVEPGTDGNGLSGDAQLIDPLDYVVSVAASATTGGGTDAEDDDVYLDRVADELRLLAPRPILPDDFAVLAKRVAGVDRATAINGYNPADSTYGNERMVAVAVVDENGSAVSAPVKTAVDLLLSEQREANFLVVVIDPSYTPISVSFTGVAWPDWNPADVETAAEQAVATYLSAADWGQPDTGEERVWINEPTVRYLEIAAVINSVAGLHYVTALTVNGGTTNVVMTGVAALPSPGAINGTVTAP